ncbi:MAG: FAD-dependent oxidoreductase, partial [Roseiflexaceae bacterium]|nr:FAD-dependent oxidoreductase [Roseiflexaceae bacterium]
GDAAANAETSYFYTDGNSRLGKLLAEGLDMRREQRVVALRHDTGRWQLTGDQGQFLGEADIVLLTPPAPQIVDILAASDLAEEVRGALTTELGRARYRRCLSLALAYDRLVARPFYALLNSDRQHPISWLALEHAKGVERCPPGHSLLIAQMAAQWSSDNYELPLEQLAPQIATLAGELLGEDLDTPLWIDLQRWRYSQPDSGCDFAALNDLGAPHGLFFAGDFTAGRGRIHLAIEQGWQVASRITAPTA